MSQQQRPISAANDFQGARSLFVIRAACGPNFFGARSTPAGNAMPRQAGEFAKAAFTGSV
jgi:hypothetical protein